MGDEKFSRRLFVKKFSAGVGIGAAGISGFSSLSSGSVKPVERDKRLPREVWIASISLRGLHPEDYIEARIRKMLNRMESVVPFQPDIVCLTELFPVSWVKERKPREEIAEEVPGSIVKRMGEFAKKYDCYIVCPIYTKKDGHIFNSAVLIDRKGDVAGIYHKAHTDTQYGKTKGVPTPGPLRQPVIEADFGKVGMQICYDANWFDTWRNLKEDGAEIVFFASQFPGGRILNTHAWSNHYYIVSSTGSDARIIDISGDDIASSGKFAEWVCAPINLEKVFVHIWPHVRKFGELQAKYGRRIHIKIWHPENWATIESLDPDVKVLEVLKEFEIPTYDEQIEEATEIQNKYRL